MDPFLQIFANYMISMIFLYVWDLLILIFTKLQHKANVSLRM